jgi:hypothetical protein
MSADRGDMPIGVIWVLSAAVDSASAPLAPGLGV